MEEIINILNYHLIPDISNIVIKYITCKTCKTLLNGKIRCSCSKYMCKCNGQTKCNICHKIICTNCRNHKYCCYENIKKYTYKSIFCSYCSDFYRYSSNGLNSHICLFEDCQTRMCNKCWLKFQGLCRGHLLLKIHHPDLSFFEGLI